MATFSLCSKYRIYHIMSNYDKIDVASHFAAEQTPRNSWCFAPFIRECVSMAMLINAHGTTIPTNRELSELVEKRITRTI